MIPYIIFAALALVFIIIDIAVTFGNPCIAHRWGVWEPYHVERQHESYDARVSPPSLYATAREHQFWQRRSCRRCAFSQRRRVA